MRPVQLAVLCLALLAFATPASAATITVNSNLDAGTGGCDLTECTLREAITLANADSAPDTITFAPLLGTLTVSKKLPSITQQLTIDGDRSGLDGAPQVLLRWVGDTLEGTIGLDLVAPDSVVRGVALVGFPGVGIRLAHLDEVVRDTFLGLDLAGVGGASNANHGAGILVISDGDQIGGTGPTDGNVVSNTAKYANGSGGNGIWVSGSLSSTIQGNRIGTDPSGTAARGNAADGIRVNGQGAVIGGAVAGAGNLVSGNLAFGIELEGGNQTAHQLFGNLIGTDVTGTLALGNADTGIEAAAANTQIGSAAAGSGNVVSGNGGNGVFANANNISLRGNHIGTSQSGTQAVPNAVHGVDVAGSAVVIGGTATGARNVISGNGANADPASRGSGIRAQGAGLVVQGNLIGVNETGSGAIANGGDGIHLLGAATNTSIGGSAVGAGNVISGNTESGVETDAGSLGTTLFGNAIGLGQDRDTVVSNGEEGVRDAGGIDVGSAVAGAGNVISGNVGDGVVVTGDATLAGNVVGLSGAASAARGNGGNGVAIQNAGVVSISTDTIAANGANGILLDGPPTAATAVSSATIGRNDAGLAFGNTGDGIRVANGATATIGTTSAGGPRIADSGGWGINVDNGSAVVERSVIGLQSAGNALGGIRVGANSTQSRIGASSSAGSNVIRDNLGPGIRVESTGNEVAVNQIFPNTGIGLDSAPFGALNPSSERPAITDALSAGSRTAVVGSTPGSGQVHLRIFDTPSGCEAGRGEQFIGEATVPAGPFYVVLNHAVQVGASGLTVTATANATTTEFSDCRAPRSVGLLAFAAPGDTAEEAGVASIAINRSGSSQGPVDVHVVTAGGTATPGADYTPVDTNVHFSDGQSSATVDVPLLDDALVEARETIVVKLSDPVNAVLASTSTATLGITSAVEQTTPPPSTPTPPPPPPPPPQHAPVAKISKATATAISGTAADADGDLAKVEVAVVQKSGKRCKVLTAKGTLKSAKCTVRTFLKAKGTTAWSFKLKHKLKKGSYVVYVRVTDAGRRSVTAQRAFRLKR
jgi:hypothetical protein